MHKIYHTIAATDLGYAAVSFETTPTFKLQELVPPRPEIESMAAYAESTGWRSGGRHPSADKVAATIKAYFKYSSAATSSGPDHHLAA